MTAAQKRKYVAERILEHLAPHGYFFRKGAVWKYNSEEKYLVSIECNLGTAGGLNEIIISWSSFFAPIQQYYNNVWGRTALGLAYYVRQARLGIPLVYFVSRSFEDMVDEIMPYFLRIILPLLPTDDDLLGFLRKAEQLRQLLVVSFSGLPRYSPIKEYALAYLSLGLPDEALRVIMEEVEQRQQVAADLRAGDLIKHYGIGILQTSEEEIKARLEYLAPISQEDIARLEKLCADALALKSIIEVDGGQSLLAEMAELEESSREVCDQYFHVRKKKK